jgi:predicted nucleic acid-binding protein
MIMAILDKNKKILLDADVIIHFIRGDKLSLLNRIFPNQLCILDEVFEEVFKGKLRTQVENLIRFKFITEIETPKTLEYIAEVASIKKNHINIGNGECYCMAYCKLNKDVLASSNLKDIKSYCEENNIQYLTTMDFLYEAYKRGLLGENDCNTFINNVISKGSKLPVKTIQEYIKIRR